MAPITSTEKQRSSVSEGKNISQSDAVKSKRPRTDSSVYEAFDAATRSHIGPRAITAQISFQEVLLDGVAKCCSIV